MRAWYDTNWYDEICSCNKFILLENMKYILLYMEFTELEKLLELNFP